MVLQGVIGSVTEGVSARGHSFQEPSTRTVEAEGEGGGAAAEDRGRLTRGEAIPADQGEDLPVAGTE